MGDLEVKNSKLYVQGKIYVQDIRTYGYICCGNNTILLSKDILATKLCFKACKMGISGLIWQKTASSTPPTVARADIQKHISHKSKGC